MTRWKLRNGAERLKRRREREFGRTERSVDQSVESCSHNHSTPFDGRTLFVTAKECLLNVQGLEEAVPKYPVLFEVTGL